ncbi:GPO family capsid scaffolding protein [Xenorhabdus griffiniae]|uniref:GPO family capsid scaffolding protein n=1 Tax=Xenorhabdus griffiniae TaxID=351672 RepID=A0ABY9XL02_9GAMM|nr:GPO family capsid scaffolding protein [Xenorhabdus griffiniae]MBE8588451.1 GPO family capsid scaffolding protein [Xenorhabdus griffiniae]WMV73595.1 GPO family capsid scaffolding protein [Xenorhabdus griffiniae]WNH03275.1 GPO family capsid scaffolding protein [Xenorhabdus griffiniae]
MSQLMTNWICIAMEGDTVDGRVMEPEWIMEAAELYDPQLYTALIWPEHERWMGTMGEVLAVKAERGDDGLLRLYAQLRPNHRLLDANRDGQLLFTSVEFTPDGNFRGTGKSYLEGLAVTSSPASVGTTRLQFSKKKKTHRSGTYKPLVIDEVREFKQKGRKMAKNTKKTWRSRFGIAEQEETSTETTNDDALQALAQAVADLEARVAAMETTQEEVVEDVETVKEVVDTEEFARLSKNLPAILKNFGKLDTLATRVPSRNPKGDKNARFNFL